MYERLAEAAQTHGADLVLCDFAQGTEEHFDFTEANRPAEGCNAAEELTRDDYFRKTYLRAQYKYSVAWNKLFRRETMGGIRFDPSLHYIEDRNFAIQFVLNSKKVVSISETLYYYYRNGNSISNSAGQRQRVGQVRLRISTFWSVPGRNCFTATAPTRICCSWRTSGCVRRKSTTWTMCSRSFAQSSPEQGKL